MKAAAQADTAALRIDKLLWFLRFVPSRALAQQLVLAGHIRVNGVRIAKPAASVGVGDILTLPLRAQIMVIELTAVPHRRGPIAEALSCYRILLPASATDSQNGAAA